MSTDSPTTPEYVDWEVDATEAELYDGYALDPLENEWGLRYPTVPETEMELRRMYFAGERDAGDGGVPTRLLAENLPAAPDSVYKRVKILYDLGRVKKVSGIGSDTGRPRNGWSPADVVSKSLDDEVARGWSPGEP